MSEHAEHGFMGHASILGTEPARWTPAMRIPHGPARLGNWQNPRAELRPPDTVRSEQISIRPRFAMKTNISHTQFGMVLEHSPEKRMIHHGQFTGAPAGIYTDRD